MFRKCSLPKRGHDPTHLLKPNPTLHYCRAKWNQKVFDFLGNVNKPVWITIIVLVWYGQELFESVISSSLYKGLWGNFLKDPCWGDAEFLANTSVTIRY